jgi:hypothetical protein
MGDQNQGWFCKSLILLARRKLCFRLAALKKAMEGLFQHPARGWIGNMKAIHRAGLRIEGKFDKAPPSTDTFNIGRFTGGVFAAPPAAEPPPAACT